MAKAGMRRPSPKEPHGTESNHKTHIPKNDAPPVPEIQGKAKSGQKQVRAVIAGTHSPSQKVYHSVPYEQQKKQEKPISDAYSVIDNDLARDNLENDITAADLQDLQ